MSVQPQSIVPLVIQNAPSRLDSFEMVEFDALLNALDIHMITREGWDRLKEMLIAAMLEVNGDLDGMTGYLRCLPKWRLSRAYDGKP